jgi:hypothetical protein
MTTPIRVTIEQTPKRVFASAADWPGWSRGGKTEELALEALVAYAPRYANVMRVADPAAPPRLDLVDLEIVGRRDGSSGTEFGVPSHPSDEDRRPLTQVAADRLVRIVAAAWWTFDRISAAAPEELRRGPRGGGRTTSKMIDHVMESDRAYAHEMGIKVPTFERDDADAIRAMRAAMLDVLSGARDGQPLAGRRWPARYAAHRIAWHALDHGWEIEDRIEF